MAFPPTRSSSGGTSSSITDADSISLLSSDSTLRTEHNNYSLNSKRLSYGYGYGYNHTTAPSVVYLDKSLPEVPDHDDNDYDPYFGADFRPDSKFSQPISRRPHARSRSPNRRSQIPISLQTQQHLANALGPDNATHTTELDTVPCAGIRIPSGPLAGLLAWRLVVRLPHGDNGKGASRSRVPPRGRADSPASHVNTFERKKARRMSWNALQGYTPPTLLHAPPLTPYEYNRTMSERHHPYSSLLGLPSSRSHVFSASTHSLPATAGLGVVGNRSPMFPPSPLRGNPDEKGSPFADEKAGYGENDFVPEPLQTYRSVLELPTTAPSSAHGPTWLSPSVARSAPTLALSTMGEDSLPDAVTTNFIFDTSLPYNQISRETLEVLGYSTEFVESLERSVSTSSTMNYEDKATVSLRIQSLRSPITFHLAPRGEPGRLGVKFLEESGVSLCLGEGGRGGIFWVDPTSTTKFLLKDVPRTVPLPKLSLQARVRALFGLTSSPNQRSSE